MITWDILFSHAPTRNNESNSFIFGCAITRKAMLVDLGALDEDLVNFITDNALDVTAIFITHDHGDHTGGLSDAIALYPGARLYANSTVCGGRPFNAVKDGDTIAVGNLSCRVIGLAGHTNDSIGLVVPGMVFTGDAIFAGSVGGTHTEEDQARQLENIRKGVFSLPDDTMVHCGHGPSSIVGYEKQYNPFFVGRVS